MPVGDVPPVARVVGVPPASAAFMTVPSSEFVQYTLVESTATPYGPAWLSAIVEAAPPASGMDITEPSADSAEPKFVQ
jgi:hypothetical protein